MIEPADMATKAATLRTLLDAKLGVRALDLSTGLRKAGRRLPRRVRKQADVLIRAEQMGANPRLARQLDGATVGMAYESVRTYLQSIDVADRRRGRALSLGASIAFNLLMVIAAFVLWLWWHGYV